MLQVLYFLRKLLQNNSFKAEFAQRSCTIAQTVFDAKRTTHFIDSLTDDVRPEMPAVFEKFTDLSPNWTATGDNPAGGSMASWDSSLDKFKSFFGERPGYFLSHMKTQFEYEGLFHLSLNVDENSKGIVVLHENEMTVPYNYSGEYFQNVPIKMKAIPEEGYYFLRWLETGDTTAQLTVISEESMELTPLFLRNGTTEPPADGAPFLKVFPNPVDNVLTLQFADVEDSDMEVTIYDALGREVKQAKITTTTFILERHVDVSDWASGVYFIRTTIGGQEKSVSFMVH